ncbi:MAG: hypothetical protein H6Q69_1323 [Firmicutes bacterium]|nr:hypothetical protein [Bacillota bacterium]
MEKRRTKLQIARLEAGYQNQNDLVEELRKDINISLETYRNIECGRNKTVDVVIAFVIAQRLNKSVEEIFLTNWAHKIHREDSDPKPAA